MGRIVNSWAFPEGLFFKALVTRLHDKGPRGNTLIAEFVRLVPHWQSYFKKPSIQAQLPNALTSRAATSPACSSLRRFAKSIRL